jgi:hypothetical protein
MDGSVQADASSTQAVAKFGDVTQVAGIEFKQSSGACGQFYFVEQISAGASFLDANGDGFLDIYFPQPKALDKCKEQTDPALAPASLLK